MLPSTLTFRLLVGLRFERRGIGFLEGDGWLDAASAFENLEEKDQRTVLARIDHWLDGGVFKKYHHGFNVPKYRDCYVFKFQALRLYGFLCNPKPQTDRQFQLCVLTSSAEKHQWATEETILKRAMDMLGNDKAKVAIAAMYPEYYRAVRVWTN